MRTYDFSPLWRSTIGFDRLFDLAESAQRASEDHYPPYNIERLGEDRYQISLAVAGFSPDEISVTAEQNVVTIEGSKTEKTEREYLYRGISHAGLQAAIQPGRLRPGQGRDVRQRPAQDRTGPGDPRGHEATANRHQRCIAGQPAQARSQGGLSDCPAAAAPKVRGCRPNHLRTEENMRPTTATDDNVFDFQALLHPGTVFEHPKDVVAHPCLTLAEKRAILASWASDASAIASCPALRAPEGLKAPVSIDAILEALCELDGGPRNPPGGKPMRLRSTERRAAA